MLHVDELKPLWNISQKTLLPNVVTFFEVNCTCDSCISTTNTGCLPGVNQNIKIAEVYGGCNAV